MTHPRLDTTTLEIHILMSIVARLTMRDLEERMTGMNLGINWMQYSLLRALSRGSFTSSELSKKFVLDPSTLVPVIDALERKGYVVRGKDPNDRRRVPLSLTDAGSAVLSQFTLSHENDMLHQSLDVLGDDKTRTLLALLRDLVRAMPGGEELLREIPMRLQSHVCDPSADALTDSTS